ncbi:MAG: hypothetical protein HQL09_09315 [Nitrospirae bacterium]|nr:hypothetical protein [Nitrospirota bacterium]
MIRLIRGIIRLAIIVLIVFFAVSIWQGGGKFRWFGEKLGDKADVIKGKKDEAVQQIKKLTGSGGGETEEQGDLENDKKPVGKHKIEAHDTAKTKSQGESGEEDGNKPSGGLWSSLLRKIKALVKE